MECREEARVECIERVEVRVECIERVEGRVEFFFTGSHWAPIVNYVI